MFDVSSRAFLRNEQSLLPDLRQCHPFGTRQPRHGRKLDALLKDRAALSKILTYHVVSGKVMAADVNAGKVKSVEGSSLTVTTAGGKVMLDKANVVKTDIAADNGVIHVIDTVVMPK